MQEQSHESSENRTTFGPASQDPQHALMGHRAPSMTDAELLKVSESSGKASGAANGFNQLSQNEIMNPFSAT